MSNVYLFLKLLSSCLQLCLFLIYLKVNCYLFSFLIKQLVKIILANKMDYFMTQHFNTKKMKKNLEN